MERSAGAENRHVGAPRNGFSMLESMHTGVPPTGSFGVSWTRSSQSFILPCAIPPKEGVLVCRLTSGQLRRSYGQAVRVWLGQEHLFAVPIAVKRGPASLSRLLYRGAMDRMAPWSPAGRRGTRGALERMQVYSFTCQGGVLRPAILMLRLHLHAQGMLQRGLRKALSHRGAGAAGLGGAASL